MSQFESTEGNIVSNRLKSKNNTILENEEGRNEQPCKPLDIIDTSPFHEGNFIDKISDIYRERKAQNLEYFGKLPKNSINTGIVIGALILTIIVILLSIKAVFKIAILIVIVLIIIMLLKKSRK